MKLVTLALSFLVAFSAQASIIETQPETAVFNNITVPATAVATLETEAVPLTAVAAGLRKKYLLPILGTDIYNVVVYVNSPADYVKSANGNEGLDSLIATQKVIAVKLDFRYNLTADQITNAFTDAVKANSVDPTSAGVADVFAAVRGGGNAAVGQSMVFMIVAQDDGTTAVTYEDPAGAATTVVGDATLGRTILAMWMGTISPTDKGLQELKNQLIK